MKITVITVCFNSAKTIEDTIRSVASQVHPDIEYLLVDGASSDSTLDVIEQYRCTLAKVISEPDRGIYDAMNKGVAMASGELIGFLNADDVYADASVLAKVANIMEREDIDALFGDVEFFRDEDPEGVVRRYRSEHFRPNRIAWGWMPAHPALFLHRRVFERFGSFRSDYRIAGDFELVARVFHGDTLKYRYLPEVLVRMRIGGVSTGGWRNTLLLNREVLRACRENGISTNILMILSKYPSKFLGFLCK